MNTEPIPWADIIGSFATVETQKQDTAKQVPSAVNTSAAAASTFSPRDVRTPTWNAQKGQAKQKSGLASGASTSTNTRRVDLASKAAGGSGTSTIAKGVTAVTDNGEGDDDSDGDSEVSSISSFALF